MYQGLVHAHSGFRWVVLILLVVATFKALLKWRSNAPYTEGDRKLNLFTMVSTHIQLLLGLVLYFINFSNGAKVRFTADMMKDSIARFYTIEHNVTMLLAIILITIGHSKSKKLAEDGRKFKTIFTYYAIALLLVLIGIPWPFRNLGAGWF